MECTAKPFLPGVARKEHRAAARVKAQGMRTRSAARLYARRSAGTMHVAGKDGEDRLVRIDARLESGKIRAIADAPRRERHPCGMDESIASSWLCMGEQRNILQWGRFQQSGIQCGEW